MVHKFLQLWLVLLTVVLLYHPSLQLIIEGFAVHQNTDSNVPSIILPNLCLHGARWDREAEQLSPLSDGEDTRGTRCSVLLTLKPSAHSESTTTSTAVCATYYDCPVLLVTSGSVREATVQSAPKLCTVPLPCSARWEQTTRTQELNSQEGLVTSPELSNGKYCPAVFLTCEWPT